MQTVRGACIVAALAALAASGCGVQGGVRETTAPGTLISEYTHAPTGRVLFVKAGTPQELAIEWLDILGKATNDSYRQALVKLVTDRHSQGLLAVRGEFPSGGDRYLEVAWGDFALRQPAGPAVALEDRGSGRTIVTDPTAKDTEAALARLVAATTEADLVALMKEVVPRGARSCRMQHPTNRRLHPSDVSA